MIARVLLITALILSAPHPSGGNFASVPAVAADCCKARLWPSPERARFIFESDRPLEYRILGLRNPTRIALDLFTPDGDETLSETARAALADAPFIADFRAARRDPNTLRFVFALDGGARHEVWRVAPVGEYGHRLALDIRPVGGPDPLLALILELEEKERSPDPDAFVVVVDPGHGGEDPGAVSPSGRREKDIVLQIARRVRDEINSRPGMRALMTREHDHFIPLARRVEIAHRLGADAFISLHADSVASPKPSGSSVFVLSTRGASSPLAKRLAKHANLSDLIGGESAAADDPADAPILRQFLRDGKKRASENLGNFLLDHIAGVNKLHGGDQVHSAGFAVLKSPSIPSALIETAFISNPKEEAKLLSDSFQMQIAKAVADALQEYGERHHVAAWQSGVGVVTEVATDVGIGSGYGFDSGTDSGTDSGIGFDSGTDSGTGSGIGLDSGTDSGVGSGVEFDSGAGGSAKGVAGEKVLGGGGGSNDFPDFGTSDFGRRPHRRGGSH